MLRLTKFTDYGFLMLAFMANDPSPMHNARDLSEACHIPLPMASKILKMLAREGLLISHRGIKGGYSLARDPQGVTASDIIGALDGPIALTECLEDHPSMCALDQTCQLKNNWERINRVIKDALDKITLREMAQTFTAPCAVHAGGAEGDGANGAAPHACGCRAATAPAAAS